MAAHVVLRAERRGRRPEPARSGSAASRRSRRRRTSRTWARAAESRPAAVEPLAGRGAVADGGPAGRGDVRLAGARGARARRPATRHDFRAELLGHVHEQLVRWPVAARPRGARRRAGAVCDSPLGPLAGGATLRDIPLRDRLREMEFELPLAGGDVRGYPAAPVTLGDVAPLLRAHLPAGDPLLPYADALAVPGAGRAGPARLPHRLGRRGAAGARRCDEPLPGRRLQDQLARRLPRRGRAAADLRRLPARGAAPRRWGTRTTRCRRCCTPWCCTGSCAGGSPATTRHVHLGGVLYLYLRGHVRPGHPGRRRRAVRGVLLAAAGGAGRGAVRPAGRGAPSGRGPAGRTTAAVGPSRPGKARMTELFEITDAADRRLALGATGLLRDFNEAGVLTAADVHVARAGRRLGRRGRRAGAARRGAGHPCRAARVGVRRPGRRGRRRARAAVAGVRRAGWRRSRPARCSTAGRAALGVRPALPRPLLAAGGAGLRRPAGRGSPGRRRRSTRRCSTPAWSGSSPGRRTTSSGPRSRRAARQWTTVLTGGPGTGKTTTVAGLLALLAEQAAVTGDPPLRIALTAPTGKARPGSRRRSRRRRRGCRRRGPGAARRRCRRSRCTGCWAPAATTAPGSGTTAATGCRTT